MESMVEEKKAATKLADKYENEKSVFLEKADTYHDKIAKLEREIARAEEELDNVVTMTKEKMEILEETNKLAVDTELQNSALVRQIQLIDAKLETVNQKTKENHKRIAEEEARFEIDERARKTCDTACLAHEEKFEIQEVQVTDAQFLAEEADRKYEESLRRLKMVEDDFSRICEKAENFEVKCTEFEADIKKTNETLRNMEDITYKNSMREDELEAEAKALDDKTKSAEQAADFGERSVEKLEQTIDKLEEDMLEEKKIYQTISLKLDETMGDMLTLTEEGMADLIRMC